MFLTAGSDAQNYGGGRSSYSTNANSGMAVVPGSDPSAVTHTVSGHVINALTGAPIARALVNLNARAVLTDPQGRFSFAGFADAAGYVLVTKPGYSASVSVESSRQQKIPDLDALIELKLYPNALLTGTVKGPDGLPLARTQVRLRRLTFDSAGPRWVSSGYTQTDVHGDFRFDTPAGRYRVSTGYAQRSQERGETVLPVTFPASTASNTEYMELAASEQRQLNLRPRVGPAFPVQIVVDGADDSDRGVRLTAITPSGVSFQVPAQREDSIYVAQLPAGTFELRASAGDRDQGVDGEARVVISPHGAAQVSIHLAPQPRFPVEATFEQVATAASTISSTTPSIQQFNLTLHNLANAGEGVESDSRLMLQPDKSSEFRVQPGRYRLGGGPSGAWFVRSASCGSTDLMSEDLLVAAGAGGSPISLVLSNAVGHLKGTVTTTGKPASGWVYLIPQQPSLVPYFEIYIQTDGTFQWSGAPGQYVAVPSSQQVREDFRNETFLHTFASAGRPVEITSGADTTTDLTLAPAGVAR